ncbi:MAG TPA: hypothetical protein VK857_10625 [Desulforhopalus sp.]|nr:hypothetical protein [Desulforhopalus sp.]
MIITTTHVTRSREAKILRQCTLPLTARACVEMIITELAVIRVVKEGLLLEEIAAETDLETVVSLTEAPLFVDRNLKVF